MQQRLDRLQSLLEMQAEVNCAREQRALALRETPRHSVSPTVVSYGRSTTRGLDLAVQDLTDRGQTGLTTLPRFVLMDTRRRDPVAHVEWEE